MVGVNKSRFVAEPVRAKASLDLEVSGKGYPRCGKEAHVQVMAQIAIVSVQAQFTISRRRMTAFLLYPYHRLSGDFPDAIRIQVALEPPLRAPHHIGADRCKALLPLQTAQEVVGRVCLPEQSSRKAKNSGNKLWARYCTARIRQRRLRRLTRLGRPLIPVHFTITTLFSGQLHPRRCAAHRRQP